MTWWVLWVAWICLFLLSYPKTDLIVHTIDGPRSFAHRSAVLALHRCCCSCSASPSPAAWPRRSNISAMTFPDNMGAVSGIVGMAGGLGGFLLPIMFGAILDWLGINSSCFMLLYGIVCGIADPELSDRGPPRSRSWARRLRHVPRERHGHPESAMGYGTGDHMSHFLERLTYLSRRASLSPTAMANCATKTACGRRATGSAGSTTRSCARPTA